MTARTHPRGTGRERALAAAHELFSERGYESTAIEDVLRASGLSRGALYHHFADKSALFAAVLDGVEQRLLARIADRAAAADRPRDAVRAGALAFLDATRDPAVRQVVLVDAPAVLGWARWREIDGRHGFGALRAGLAAAVAAGELSLEPELVESWAHLLLASLMELALLIADADDPGRAHARAVATIERLLAGLGDARR